MTILEKCPGCGHNIDWDTKDEFWYGEPVQDCPGCNATLYGYGTAPCCWRLELEGENAQP